MENHFRQKQNSHTVHLSHAEGWVTAQLWELCSFSSPNSLGNNPMILSTSACASLRTPMTRERGEAEGAPVPACPGAGGSACRTPPHCSPWTAPARCSTGTAARQTKAQVSKFLFLTFLRHLLGSQISSQSLLNSSHTDKLHWEIQVNSNTTESVG